MRGGLDMDEQEKNLDICVSCLADILLKYLNDENNEGEEKNSTSNNTDEPTLMFMTTFYNGLK